MLSEHFSVSEFEYSDTARAYGISNKMDTATKRMASHTCTYMLEPLRKLLNSKYAGDKVSGVVIRITSGYRCLKLNRKVGSKDNSQHTKAQAADIEVTIKYKDGSKKVLPYTELYENIKQWVKDGRLHVDQCIQEKSGNAVWVHVSLASQINASRGQFLKFNGSYYITDCIIK